MPAFDPNYPFLAPTGTPSFTSVKVPKKMPVAVDPAAVPASSPPLMVGMGLNPAALPRLKSVGMGFGIDNTPPATTNAVALSGAMQKPGENASDPGATGTGQLASEKKYVQSGPSAPQTPPGEGGSTSPGGVGYNAVSTSAPGITRVNQAGQSPLFTNLEAGAAVDDMGKMRSAPLPSVEGFMNTVKSGSLGLLAPGGGVGDANATYTAGLDKQIAHLDSKADSLFSTGGLVDSWRGRGALRQRNKLATEKLAVGNLANTQAETKLRKQMLDQHFALGTAQNATAIRGQDAGLLPHMFDIGVGKASLDALSKGDPEKARELQTLKSSRNIVQPKFSPVHDAAGVVTGFFDDKVGLPSFQPYNAVEHAAEAKKQRAARVASGQ